MERENNDIEYQRDEVAAIKKAIETNPAWAASMLPGMKERLAKHEKRLAELESRSAK